MKISKRDKTILLVLLVVFVIAIFIMYGIVPAYNDLKAQKEELAKLQDEVDKLNRMYRLQNASKVEKDIEDILMEYYTKEIDFEIVNIENKSSMAARISFRDSIARFIDDNKGNGKLECSDLDKIINSDSIVRVDNDDEYQEGVNITYVFGDTTLEFEYHDIDSVCAMFEALKADNQLQYSNPVINVSMVGMEKVYTGKVKVTRYFLPKGTGLPKQLVEGDLSLCLDAPQNQILMADTVQFTKVPNAKYYQIYRANLDNENNLIDYSLVVNRIDDNQNDLLSYNVGNLGKGYYVVTAVGNYKDAKVNDSGVDIYYRTILSKYLYENNFGFEIA